jgi:hypothetical protein
MTDGESKKKPSESKGSRPAGQGQGKGKHQQSSRPILNSDSAVPMLRYGAGNNFYLFKRRVAMACMAKYKNLGRLIMDENYYVPPPVDTSLYDLNNDPHEIEKGRLREAHKRLTRK